MEPICPPEYLLKPQLFSFGNLLPLTPVCVLNKAKEYQSLQVADAAEKLLHNHAGNAECSMVRDSFPVNSAGYRSRRGIDVDELRHQLEQLKDVGNFLTFVPFSPNNDIIFAYLRSSC